MRAAPSLVLGFLLLAGLTAGGPAIAHAPAAAPVARGHVPVPAAALSFPHTQRWARAAWNLLFNPNERLTPAPAKPADWNRGAYLVEALGHCGECHTPRRFTQSLDNSRKFAGAVTEGWKADNITADTQSGVGGWSDDALVSYLLTRHAHGP